MLTCPSGTRLRHTFQEAGLLHHLAPEPAPERHLPVNRSCLEGVGHWQECEGEGPRPRIFPMWAWNHVSVPLETGACPACEAEPRIRSLSKRPTAAKLEAGG